ncbi:hypothetical protein [Sphingomonas parva]|uniref:hypothetical protein n=1 Tax=Sphingomonas parva TaxID=2555898 RepID=UPI001CDC4708|nr:hypothetical protein [Sphingomonas parva]
MATAATAAMAAKLTLDIGSSVIVRAVGATYHVAGAINEFIDRHIAEMRTSDIPTVERSGRVLEAAKTGFGIGYAAPVVVIAAGQILLGNPLSAVVTVGSALTLSNPVAMTCAAVGAVYYGYGALSENEREALLLRLGHGLEIGIELVRSIIDFAVSSIKRILSSEQIAEFKAFVRSAAESFGRHLSEVTGLLSDKLSDGFVVLKETSEWAASAAVGIASGGVSQVRTASGYVASAAQSGASATYDGVAAAIGKLSSKVRGTEGAEAGGTLAGECSEGGTRSSAKGTTEIGYVNRNRQEVLRATGQPGNDHNQTIYVLRCGECGHEYGANGSDIFQRRCPEHDGGAAGLAFEA